MAPRAPAPAPYQFKLIGAPRTPLRDLYHALVRWPWGLTLGFFLVVFLAGNVGFAVIYARVGGVHNAAPGSLWDGFCFSVETMATIGYGAMYPEGRAAHLTVTIEAFVGLLYSAMATGLIFAKFARPRARMRWTSRAVISPVSGVPTLQVRVGNERASNIVDAQIRITMSRTEVTAEGKTLYRNVELLPLRDRLMSLSRAWLVMHVIDEKSPMFGDTPERLLAVEAELNVSVVGLDDATMQPVFSQKRYFPSEIVWGARHADIVWEDAAGDLVVDLRHFDEIERVASSQGQDGVVR